MDPEVMARISNRIGYASGNRDSGPYLEARVRHDPAVYPPAAIRAWTRIKTGQ